MDSITGLIATIDCEGIIQDTNRAWMRFMSNQPAGCPDTAPGSSYFDVWRWLTGADTDHFDDVEKGIRALFDQAPGPFESAFRAQSSTGEPLFVLRASRLEDPEDQLAVLVHNQVAQVQEILVRITESRVKRALHTRELQSLNRLGSMAGTFVTEAAGLGPLRMTLPDEFARLTEIYADVLELAMVHRIYKVAGTVSVRLRMLAEDLGCVNAHPRDLIDIHKRAFRERVPGLSPGRAELLLDEGRLVLLELMGYLASYYRGGEMCRTCRAHSKSIENWPGEEAAK